MSGHPRQYPLLSRRIYRLTGTEATDLLQRISTADVAPLAEGRPVATLLTNEKGRVVDLACVMPETNGSLLLAGVGDDDGRIARWLERFIIMEDVKVVDVSEAQTASVVYAEAADGRWTLPDANLDSVVPVPMGRHRWGLAIGRRREPFGTIPVVEEATFSRDRVTAGVPWVSHEIDDRRHPLEARLRPLISFTKGCYVGQEVVARLDAYRKVQMALTRFEGALKPSASAPIPLQTSDGHEAGMITTIASGSTNAFALGFVRIEYLTSGATISTPDGSHVRPIDTDPQQDIYA